MKKDVTSLGGSQGAFPVTRWGTVLSARDAEERGPHLDRLIRDYWKPVYLYIRLAWNETNDGAKDLTQSFFVRFIEKDFLKDVSPERGRFRTWMRACLKNFLLDQKDRAAALRRGGGRRVVPLEYTDLPAAPEGVTPEEAFDLEWTRSLLSRALERTQVALRNAGRESAYRMFHEREVEPPPGARPSYAELARRHAVSEQTVKSGLDLARRALRRAVESLVREDCETDQDAQRELEALFPP